MGINYMIMIDVDDGFGMQSHPWCDVGYGRILNLRLLLEFLVDVLERVPESKDTYKQILELHEHLNERCEQPCEIPHLKQMLTESWRYLSVGRYWFKNGYNQKEDFMKYLDSIYDSSRTFDPGRWHIGGFICSDKLTPDF